MFAAVLSLSLSIPSLNEELEAAHTAMLETLEAIRVECLTENIYLGWGPVEALREQLATLPEGRTDRRLERTQLALGRELLRVGETRQAIEVMTLGVAGLEALPAGTRSDRLELAEARVQLGVAHLRLAEDLNCCAYSNRDSCIFPIQGDGVHKDPEPSRQAMSWFRKALAGTMINSRPGRKARWLLNVAAMTVGEYPDAIPEGLRLDPSSFTSSEDFPRFVDVATEVGLTDMGLAGGLVVEDFDGDGRLDLMTSDSNADGALRLYMAQPDGTYVERSDEAGLTGLYGGLNLVSADYDNDGDVDVFVLRGAWLRKDGQHPNSLLCNDGKGGFLDVTFFAGLGHSRWPTQTAAFADYDNDGDLDLYVGNESEPDQPAPSELWRNEGDGTFVNVAGAAGVTNDAYAKAVSWGDIDGDGDPDLYVSNMASPNRLYRNEGDGTFVDIAEEAGVTTPISGFPCWFFDFDNDGALDLFAASYGGERAPSLADVAGAYMGLQHKGEVMRLYRGDGAGGFTDVTDALGFDTYTLPMGSNFGDADLDGYPDIYLGTGYPFYEGLMPNVMLRNRRGEGFADVTTAGGFGHLQKGHGVGFADLDDDGDQDVVVRMGGAYPGDSYRCVLFRNPGNGNHWLKVQLRGEGSNRFGVGAHIRVDLVEGGAPRSVHRVVTTGGSFGCNPMRQELGLGAAERIERVEVWWPTTDTRRVYEGIELDQALELFEGSDKVRVLPQEQRPLGSEG